MKLKWENWFFTLFSLRSRMDSNAEWIPAPGQIASKIPENEILYKAKTFWKNWKKVRFLDFWKTEKSRKNRSLLKTRKKRCKNAFFVIFIFPTFRSNKLFWKNHFWRKRVLFWSKPDDFWENFCDFFWTRKKHQKILQKLVFSKTKRKIGSAESTRVEREIFCFFGKPFSLPVRAKKV